MMKGFVPTSYENLGARLAIRYMLFYASAVIIGVLTALRGVALFFTARLEVMAFLFVLLAAGAALLTVSNTYLLILTAIKGFYDAQLMFRITFFVKGGYVGFWEWNGCFFLTAASFVLFLLAATNAARFSFESNARDLVLILSKPFAKYLIESLLLIALATLLYLLWPHLLALMPAL
ncbi:MAG: hypothetical protein IKA06_06130 [Clostridia bacterium]|nr:hypothetical protein [Clostridia bacterium]